MRVGVWQRWLGVIGLGLIVVGCGASDSDAPAPCDGGPCEIEYTCAVTIVNQTASILDRYLSAGGTGALQPPIAPGETGLATLEGLFQCNPSGGQPCLGSGTFRVYAQSSNDYFQGNVTWVPCEENVIVVDVLTDPSIP
jgi:hypothetical protein